MDNQPNNMDNKPQEHMKSVNPARLTKRDATPEEEEQSLIINANHWNNCNPSYTNTIDDWRKRLTKAKAEGYKSEVCECGVTFLAFHHYTTCRHEGCPFSDGVTMLERITDSLNKEPNDEV